MPSPVHTAGTLQIAAALVFHLPGARLELSSPSGDRCSIGPMTDPRCTLHPAEFRQLVIAAGNGPTLGTLLGFALVDEPTLTLTSSGVDMDHLGGGLYRVAGCETTSFAFTTSLPADQVDDVLTSLNSVPALERATDGSGASHEEGVALCASLVRDDGLGVTLVAISPLEIEDLPRCEAVARASVSACLVAEMEQLTRGLDDIPFQTRS
ncbi:MAG: hypothetical protein F4Y99_01450 [Acidimicrobiaceae bacterium]|nr:hypothetical protein [Acidimicrobiaceae bacterium]MDE0516521.1 hypothetical protein [Acidimicrobiaceae bacterium]MDE0656435.1 hypothetical protein [Acidimicrobiaceae bacterium]MXZ94580.1 hypothetical protein [Acidimicrobiaceae bacterium]MYF44243.1 hypothetical protein [Acidimicrobiaceae bacterium]